MHVAIALAAVLSAGAAACASSGGSAAGRRASCPLTAADSAFLSGGPVFRDCAVDERAKLVQNTARPDYRPTSPGNKCYSAELEFVVDTLGRVELPTARVVRSNDRAFADAVFATLSAWRYVPAQIGNMRVRQIVTERQGMSTMVVVVPRGQSPTPPSGSTRPPSC